MNLSFTFKHTYTNIHVITMKLTAAAIPPCWYIYRRHSLGTTKILASEGKERVFELLYQRPMYGMLSRPKSTDPPSSA